MAKYNLRTVLPGGLKKDVAESMGGAASVAGAAGLTVGRYRIDAKEINDVRGTDLAAGDQIVLDKVPPGYAMIAGCAVVHTAAGGAMTFDLRYGTTSFLDNVNGNSAGATVETKGNWAAFANLGTTDVEVDINLDAAPGNLDVEITVIYLQIET